MKAVLSLPGGCLPGVPGLVPPALQGVLALRASCLSLLICDPRAGLLLAEEACEQEDLHMDVLSLQQAETKLLVRAYPRTLTRLCPLRSYSHCAVPYLTVFVCTAPQPGALT